ncbi:ComEC/Rec2 family competence protein [uncultured Megasphaera sp.]|uniref:ComEC/Rec2 family competence protein n=1 Tax=uncultured Megasphaera sp. TaxID=165188 RepID=UPI00259A7033|nr:ComEC/Rec2 family competence protein [uncultured Megasphaera sp.]
MKLYLGLAMAVAFACGIAVADAFLLPWYVWLALAVLCAPLSWLARQKPHLFLALLLIAVFFCGAGRMQWDARHYASLPVHLAGKTWYIEGTVVEKKNSYSTDEGTLTRYVLTLDRLAYSAAGAAVLDEPTGNLYVTLPGSKEYIPSTRLAVTAAVRPIRYYGNEGLYDARHRDREGDTFLKAYAKAGTPVRILAPPRGLSLVVYSLRERLVAFYGTVLSRDQANMLSSLLFGGHYDELPPALLESFSTTGIIHILSVSGSHVALLLSLIQLLGRSLKLREAALFSLSAVVVLFYGALSDFTAPVVRAAAMGIIAAGSLVARRDYTAFHALALTSLVMLIYSPCLLFDLSFRLSYGASAGIILLRQPISRVLTALPPFLRDGIAVCVSAQLLLVPLLLASFSSLPVYSVFANILVGPILDLVILLGLAASVAGLLFLPLGQVLLAVIQPFMELAVKGNYFLASLPHSRWWLGALPWYSAAAYYLLIGAIFFLPEKRRLLMPLAALVFLVPSCYAWWQKPELTVYIFDVGNDKATCVVHDDSSAYLWYNKSRWSNPEQAACVLVPALRYHGIFALESVTISGETTGPTATQLCSNLAVQQVIEAGEKAGPYTAAAVSLPYYVYDTIPHTDWPSMACLEVRSLQGISPEAFPKEAAALVVYDSGQAFSDRAWKEWRRLGQAYGIPCFTPALDGAITATWRQGTWSYTTAGGTAHEA